MPNHVPIFGVVFANELQQHGQCHFLLYALYKGRHNYAATGNSNLVTFTT